MTFAESSSLVPNGYSKNVSWQAVKHWCFSETLPAGPWSMKDLCFWVISSRYSSIFAKTKARFFTFKNLQAANELKVTKYLGFCHIGGWFSPTLPHKSSTRKRAMMLGDRVISSHPSALTKSFWVRLPPIMLGLVHFRLILVLKSLLLMVHTLSWDERWTWQTFKNPQSLDLWALLIWIFGRTSNQLLPWRPFTYLSSDFSRPIHTTSRNNGISSQKVQVYQRVRPSSSLASWSTKNNVPNDLFCRPSKRDFVGLVSLRCVKWLRKCHDCSTAPETRLLHVPMMSMIDQIRFINASGLWKSSLHFYLTSLIVRSFPGRIPRNRGGAINHHLVQTWWCEIKICCNS